MSKDTPAGRAAKRIESTCINWRYEEFDQHEAASIIEAECSIQPREIRYGIKSTKHSVSFWITRPDGLPFSGRKCEMLAVEENGDLKHWQPYEILPLPGQNETN